MNSPETGPPDDLLEHLLVPVADADDAATTARAVARYGPARVTVAHVVEKGEGVPDKTPVEQSEAVAAAAFDAFRETLPEAEEAVAYRRDVVAAVVDLADDVDASAVGYCPRTESRLRRFLAGDKSLRLLTEADRPVIAFPDGDDG